MKTKEEVIESLEFLTWELELVLDYVRSSEDRRAINNEQSRLHDLEEKEKENAY